MSNNKFSISFGVKGFFPFPFSIVMQIYAHLFCLSLSNCRLIVFIDKTETLLTLRIMKNKAYTLTLLL